MLTRRPTNQALISMTSSTVITASTHMMMVSAGGAEESLQKAPRLIAPGTAVSMRVRTHLLLKASVQTMMSDKPSSSSSRMASMTSSSTILSKQVTMIEKLSSPPTKFRNASGGSHDFQELHMQGFRTKCTIGCVIVVMLHVCGCMRLGAQVRLSGYVRST